MLGNPYLGSDFNYIYGIDIEMLIQNSQKWEFQQCVHRHTQGRATPLFSVHERMRACNLAKIMSLECLWHYLREFLLSRAGSRVVHVYSISASARDGSTAMRCPSGLCVQVTSPTHRAQQHKMTWYNVLLFNSYHLTVYTLAIGYDLYNSPTP